MRLYKIDWKLMSQSQLSNRSSRLRVRNAKIIYAPVGLFNMAQSSQGHGTLA